MRKPQSEGWDILISFIVLPRAILKLKSEEQM